MAVRSSRGTERLVFQNFRFVQGTVPVPVPYELYCRSRNKADRHMHEYDRSRLADYYRTSLSPRDGKLRISHVVLSKRTNTSSRSFDGDYQYSYEYGVRSSAIIPTYPYSY
eukprot:scaffold642596_cov19-Prasinocladus_malaysianus.AAC.1